jgi:hypothetical protein
MVRKSIRVRGCYGGCYGGCEGGPGRLGLLAAVLFALGLLAGSVAAPAEAGEQGQGPWRDALEGPVRDQHPATGAAATATSRAEGFARLVTLREGTLKGLVEAVGTKPSSYTRVHLTLRNKSAYPLRVDVCGSHLVPRKRGSCQRLGLGPIVTPRHKQRKKKRKTAPNPRPPDQPPGTVIIGLKAGEEKTVQLHTCCLDSGKPAPRSQAFEVGAEPLPAVREESLRWWADNPAAPQGLVNRAIWQSCPVEDGSYDFTGGGRQPPLGGNAIASHAGTVYTLRQGELMARDPDGIVRFLGTQMDAVHPTDSAVYAVSWGTASLRTGSSQPPRELWRLVYTGDTPWAHVATIAHDLRIDEIKVAPSGEILLLTQKGLYSVDRPRKRLKSIMLSQDTNNLSVAFVGKGKAHATLRRPPGSGYYQGGELKGESMPVCELWSIELATGEKTRLREFWNVKQIRTGAAGLFALTPGGKLRRLAGRSFRNAPGQQEYDRIIHVGRKYTWLEDKRSNLVTVDKVGRIRVRGGPRVGGADTWGIDAHSDALVWRSSNSLWRMDAAKGKRAKVGDSVRDGR